MARSGHIKTVLSWYEPSTLRAGQVGPQKALVSLSKHDGGLVMMGQSHRRLLIIAQMAAPEPFVVVVVLNVRRAGVKAPQLGA